MEIDFFNYTSGILEVSIRCKKQCSRLNAPIVAKVPWFPSNPLRVNQLIVELVSPNAGVTRQKPSANQMVSTLNKHGHDEETMGKKRRLPALALLDGRIAYKKKLVKKRGLATLKREKTEKSEPLKLSSRGYE